MSFTRTSEHGRTTLRFSGSLDVLTAIELQGLIRDLVVERPRQVLIDLARLELIDGSGVAALVSLFRHLAAGGTRVRAEGARGQPLEIFKLTGLVDYLGIAAASAEEPRPLEAAS